MLQYKRVCIPGVGTFEIVQQSPQLDVADKLIAPPVYTLRHNDLNDIPDHQFSFFYSVGNGGEKLREELCQFGERLKQKARQSPFYWKGFGTLQFNSNQLVFEPEEIRLASLQPVPAKKVLRENVQHSMLVGDQEMTSQQVTDVLSQVEYKRPWFIIVGWVVLIIAIIAIILLLYYKNFQNTSTGLQTRW